MTIATEDIIAWAKARIIAIGAVCAALLAIAGAWTLLNPNFATESFVAQAQEETLEIVDDKLQSTNDIQIQLGNKVYGDTIRGYERELRQVQREQRQHDNDIPQDLIDAEDDILEDIANEKLLLNEMREKLKKRIE